MQRSKQVGFTIVETMIALSVTGILILTVTVATLNIGHLFQKGSAGAAIQDNTREIINQLASDLQLTSGSFSVGTGTITVSGASAPEVSICIGGAIRYTAAIGYQVGSGTEPGASGAPAVPYIPHVLWRDEDSTTLPAADYATSSTPCKPVNLSSSSLSSDDNTGSELVGADTRLTMFSIGGNGPYSVTVGEAYGPIYLLTNNTPDAIRSATSSDPTQCTGTSDDEYCSTDSLTTTVTPRIIGN